MGQTKAFKMNNKGVTILEAVIAMTVIVIVSAAAISCIESFSVSSAVLNAKNETSVMVENLLEIFKATNSLEDYRNARERFVGHASGGCNTESNGIVTCNESFNVSGCTVDVYLRYEENTATITIIAKDSKRITFLSIKNYEKTIVRV